MFILEFISHQNDRAKCSMNRFLTNIRVKAISGCRFVRVRGISNVRSFELPWKIPWTQREDGRAWDQHPMENLTKSLLHSNSVARTRLLKCFVTFKVKVHTREIQSSRDRFIYQERQQCSLLTRMSVWRLEGILLTRQTLESRKTWRIADDFAKKLSSLIATRELYLLMKDKRKTVKKNNKM